jgi:hypothetical protein
MPGLRSAVDDFTILGCLLSTASQNYGQCDRIDKRLDDPWWQAHFASLAQRHIATFERELGWAFWTWKLDDIAGEELAAISPIVLYGTQNKARHLRCGGLSEWRLQKATSTLIFQETVAYGLPLQTST